MKATMIAKFAFSVVLGVAAVISAAPREALAHDSQGATSGTMGPGMMGGRYGMGPGMMGQGWGQQGMGPGMMRALPQDLSVADVRHMMQHQLAWQGNPNLKLGKVEEKDEDTIIANVVTKDGSLVQSFEFDRHTGRMHPVQ